MSAFSVLSFLALTVAGRLHVPVACCFPRESASPELGGSVTSGSVDWLESKKGKCIDLAGRPKYKKAKFAGRKLRVEPKLMTILFL